MSPVSKSLTAGNRLHQLIRSGTLISYRSALVDACFFKNQLFCSQRIESESSIFFLIISFANTDCTPDWYESPAGYWLSAVCLAECDWIWLVSYLGFQDALHSNTWSSSWLGCTHGLEGAKRIGNQFSSCDEDWSILASLLKCWSGDWVVLFLSLLSLKISHALWPTNVDAFRTSFLRNNTCLKLGD